MGTRNGPYKADFPIGTNVRVRARDFLETFRQSWKFHNPLKECQLDYSGRGASVARVGYYYGGDELYTLEGIPGIWHECCLEESEI
jgi:hypothetical protein